jgi:hypothetical protein
MYLAAFSISIRILKSKELRMECLAIHSKRYTIHVYVID